MLEGEVLEEEALTEMEALITRLGIMEFTDAMQNLVLSMPGQAGLSIS